MTVFEMIEKVYDAVKKQATNVTPQHRIGGIWSPDYVGEFGDIRIMMTDGGYGKVVIVPGVLNCHIGYGSNTLGFMVGTEEDLKKLYDQLVNSVDSDFVDFIKDGASL